MQVLLPMLMRKRSPILSLTLMRLCSICAECKGHSPRALPRVRVCASVVTLREPVVRCIGAPGQMQRRFFVDERRCRAPQHGTGQSGIVTDHRVQLVDVHFAVHFLRQHFELPQICLDLQPPLYLTVQVLSPVMQVRVVGLGRQSLTKHLKVHLSAQQWLQLSPIQLRLVQSTHFFKEFGPGHPLLSLRLLIAHALLEVLSKGFNV
mmetsp:Transcript_72615/g.121686  ORF Transcript_72615/g.121686 Transcript_72615/m.121686 type:complete len:206 (+) Transcript_72615:226-843(+)